MHNKEQVSKINSFRCAGPRARGGTGQAGILNQVGKLTEKVRFEQRCEGSKS